ncbi:MAG: hypothetical protein KF866_02765 [Phycisphaeraceae bacterium]|nr:hypothetical protein [Phycisphaeraceae bacterium]MCW5753382.1 hypothetical protein [Phycisphaeraceae bacterium]
MRSPLQSILTSKYTLPGVIVCAAVVAFLPTSVTGKLTAPGELVRRISGPISHPVSLFARWIDPAPEAPQPEELLRLKDELDSFRTLYFQELARSADLHKRLLELQEGLDLMPSLPVRVRAAPVIGYSRHASGGVMQVRAGMSHGVDLSTVATIRGAQLVGRVVEAGRSTSLVRPIIDPASPPMLARVMVTQTGEGPACTLTPAGDGTLVGPLEDLSHRPDSALLEPAIGQEVRLDDPAWPAAARMLRLGVVEAIRPAADAPMRRVVVVRPAHDLLRLSEVVLRIPQSRGDSP